MSKALAILQALRPWASVALAGVLALLLARSCNRESDLSAALRRAQEAARLMDAGQTVVQPAEDLRSALDNLAAQNEQLRAALEEARRAAPGARPVAVATAQTAPAPVSGTPTTRTAPCLLAEGDALTLRVDEVVLQTRAGNRLLIGTASALRGETLLLRAPFSAPLTHAQESAAPVQARGWGAGPWLGAGSDGWAAGAAVAAPAVRVPLLGWSAEASAGAGIGPSGRVAASLAVILRP